MFGIENATSLKSVVASNAPLVHFLFAAISIVLTACTSDTVNIGTHGPIEYCNVDPLRWDFEPLTSFDLKRIKKLQQVHILARHGARILPKPIKSIFPNSDAKFECKWTTVNTRYYENQKDWMSFRLHFVNNEQIVEGNCHVSGSLQQVIPQHRANAQMAARFYIGEEAHHLMTQSELNDISGQLTYYNQLRQNIDIPEIKIISANYERTITSATVFMSEFLNINTPSVAMELYTHDFQSDPYAANKDKMCPQFAGYIDDLGMASKQFQELMKSELAARVDKEWFAATGNHYSYDYGASATLMYCGGLDVPLSWDAFLDSLNMSYAIREAILSNNETSYTSCKLAASPMAWLFRTLIKNHIVYLRQVEMYRAAGEDSEEIKTEFEHEKSEVDNEYYLYAEQAKLVYHSVHDTSILYLLQAMNLSNGRQPMFAEMLTLEIYERSEDDPWYNYNIDQVTNELFARYLFRWTRKGKALAPFPGCQKEYELTKSSLCSLSVLMDVLEYGENIKEWEQTCQNVTGEYFDTHTKHGHAKKEKKKKKKEKSEFMGYLWTFVFGVSVGVAVMLFVNKYHAWFLNEWKYESIA